MSSTTSATPRHHSTHPPPPTESAPPPPSRSAWPATSPNQQRSRDSAATSSQLLAPERGQDWRVQSSNMSGSGRRPGRPGSPSISIITSSSTATSSSAHDPISSETNREAANGKGGNGRPPSSSLSSSTDTLTSLTSPTSANTSANARAAPRISGAALPDSARAPAGGNGGEAALQYVDSLIGPRPTRVNMSAVGSQRPTPSAVEYEDENNERVARAMMQGLGLSASAEGSRSSSPERASQREAEENAWAGYQRQQQQSQSQAGSAGYRFSPPEMTAIGSNPSSASASASSSARDSPQHQVPHSHHQQQQSHTPHQPHPYHHHGGSSSTSAQLHHPSSSSSLGSVHGGITSPLSPLVEPFSPATSASGQSGAGWGPSGSASGSTGLAGREREPSNLDLRSNASSSGHQPPQMMPPPPLPRLYQHQVPQQQQPDFPTSPHPLQYHSDIRAQQQTRYAPFGDDLQAQAMQPSLSRDNRQMTTFMQPQPQVPIPLPLPLAVDRGGYVRAGYAAESPTLLASSSTASGFGSAAGVSSVLGGSRGVATLSGGGGGGGGSASGAASDAGGGSSSNEEISTIFVVGFPEDMLEREFQNMFVFANGFQAATLKVPAVNVVQRERERELAAAAAAGGYDGTTTSAPESLGGYEDYYGSPTAVSGVVVDPSRTSIDSDDPTAQLQLQQQAQLLAGGAANPQLQRKQIIGFARFNTRAQALDARDILSGKKVDAEKGCVLKAEMAKKNLHTKQRAGGVVDPTNVMMAGTGVGAGSFPLSALDQGTLAKLAGQGTLSPAVLAELARQNTAQQQAQATAASSGNGGQSSFGDTAATAAAARESKAFEAFHSVPGGEGGASSARWPDARSYSHSREREGHDSNRERAASPDYQYGAVAPRSPISSSASPPVQHQHFRAPPSASGNGQPPWQQQSQQSQQSQQQQNSMMQQLDDSRGPPPRTSRDQFERPAPTSFQPASDDSHQRSQQQQYAQLQPQPPAYGYAAQGAPPRPTGVGYAQQPQQGTGSPMMESGVGAGGLIPRTQNPADMNAPKNTLYVGGLPAVLPSLTGPFSAAHLEDSLRNAFSRCPGFRRLSFRSKSNGPIVFVEFDDVHFATRALQEMYGNTLGGMVKGGIRLSYSKNPLGVRSSNPSSSNASTSASTSSPLPQSSGGFHQSQSGFSGDYSHLYQPQQQQQSANGAMSPPYRPGFAPAAEFRNARSPPAFAGTSGGTQSGFHHGSTSPAPAPSSPAPFGNFSPFS